ncbi:hypothetical protein OG535_28965 [Kitasatospora sp. NBC_00085]|uniref:hypothetical protein n=1 Tax=Kitasatospora sp. NBC_00085 TaxID=2903566 RepID=UPI0032445376
MDGTRAVEDECIHLLGYGDWIRPASATLIGRSARTAVEQIRELTARPETGGVRPI